MGRYFALLLALITGSWIAFTDQQLPEPIPVSAPATSFSADRAFADVNLMAAEPHPVGSPQNMRVRDALIGRMTELGLSPQVRPGTGVQLSRYASDRVSAGYVENVVGILPGRDRQVPAVALMAHYDSVPASPGAADDIMGVAAILETVRAIKARGVPARDVMLVITDGEEEGLLGANHFFRRDPLAKRIGLTLNVEARGGGGRVQMFQTSPQNGEIIDLYQRTATRPASSSLAVLVYEKMPNDTDLTETLRAGLPGMNYAIIGSQFDYHSPTSTPANLERGSLQDVGTQVLAAAGEAAFAAQLPGKVPSVVYSNLFGDTVIAYPVWFGWVLIGLIVVLLAFAVRWARHDGAFPPSDMLRGMGGLLFGALTTVAVLQFARLLTGADFGYMEQRFLLAQVDRWEWAIMLLSLGVIMLSAGDMATGRRWMAAIPVAAGLGCSAFGGFEITGAVTGVLAGVIGVLIYDRPTTRKGAWGGALLLGLIIAVAAQILVPGAAYVVVWPLLVASIGAAATALSAKRGILSLALLAVLAAAALGWQGGISHFAFLGMDMMALFSLQMITAGLVLWPLAQPDKGARKGLVVGSTLLIAGLAITLFVRSDDPWSARYPQVTYVGYQMDQDTGRAWRYSPIFDHSSWTAAVLRAGGGEIARHSHWAWPRPMLAVPAKPLSETPPDITARRAPDGTLDLTSMAAPGAATMTLRVRATTAGRLIAINGVATELALPPGKWVQISWATARYPLNLTIRPNGQGRLDVRYRMVFNRWPVGVPALPLRPVDLMPWDDSDGTFVVGTRAFTW